MNDEQQIIEPVPTLAGYKKVPTFKLWIANQFPYIETDFDAITNYELLQAVIKYLNTIIENENNVESNVTALYNAFVNLHDYVENYFDNLDVQEEINNKLDEMVEDGTLDNILNNYVQLFKVYNTHTDMIADSSNFVLNMKIKTLGYYSINDGGNAEYIVTDVENSNIFQESIGNGLYINLLFQDTIYSKQVGLKGDGTTDESVALNNFFVKSVDANKVLNSGTYLTTIPVIIQGKWTEQQQYYPYAKYQRIIFDNASINYQGTENGIAILFNNFTNAKIEGLYINNESNICYVDFIGVWFTEFTNFKVKKIGIRHNYSDYSVLNKQSIEHIWLSNGVSSGGIEIDSSDSYCNGIYFNNMMISASQNEHNVILKSANSNQEIVFDNCDLSYATDSVFNIEQSQTGGGNITLKNCYLDSAIPMFKDYNLNNIQFNNYGSFDASSSSASLCSIITKNNMKNIIMPSRSSDGLRLPFTNINLALNGDIERNSRIDNRQDRLFGPSSDDCEKTYIDSNENINGHALELAYNLGENDSKILYFDALPAPDDNIYHVAIRCKKTQGSGNITLSFASTYNSYNDDMLPLNKEVILTSRMSFSGERNATESNRGFIQVGNTSNLKLEIYEVIVTYGKGIMYNLPLHEKAKRNIQFQLDANGNLQYRTYSPTNYGADTGWGAWKTITAT